MSPSQGWPGQTLDITLMGVGPHVTFEQVTGTIFDQTSTTLFIDFGQGLHRTAVNSLTGYGPHRMVANITIPPGTPPGRYDWVVNERLVGDSAVRDKHPSRIVRNGFEVLPDTNASVMGSIRGWVYRQRGGSSCFRSGSDLGIMGQMVEATSATARYYGITDTMGRYSIDAPLGTYQVRRVLTSVKWNPVCPLAGNSQTVTLTRGNNIADNVNFGDTLSQLRDLLVSYLFSARARPGFAMPCYLEAANNGNFVENDVELKLVLDDTLILDSTRPAYTSRRGDTLVWQIPSLNSGAKYSVTIFQHLPADPGLLGRTIFLCASVKGQILELLSSNNRLCNSQTITGSYDPNDKQVSPVGDLRPADSVLTYLIRFQNSGTDTAFTVVVRDTLSTLLDISTLEMLSASHLYRLELKSGREARWTFVNILLPDSNTNEPASHGHIQFRIKRDKNMQLGQTIENRASNYFDFNTPVATNTVRSTLSLPIASRPIRRRNGHTFVPNPVAETAQIILPAAAKQATLIITDLSGRVVQEQKGLAGKAIAVTRQGLPSGLYLYRLSEAGTTLAEGKLVAE